MYAPLKGIRNSAFSVLPFTRAHIMSPRSVLSVPEPDTQMSVIAGLSLAKISDTDIVRSYVTRRYACSSIPAAETPRQKNHAS
jgi:hypothetical protein